MAHSEAYQHATHVSEIHHAEHGEESPEQLSTVKLLTEIASKVSLLVGKETELARNELKQDLRNELAMAKRLAVGVVAALATLNMLLVAAAFALAPHIGGVWAALSVAGFMFLCCAIAGVIAWRMHVKKPLATTRKTLREDVQWAKQELT